MHPDFSCKSAIYAVSNQDAQQCLTLYGLQDRRGVVGYRSLSFGVAEI
jgi:hypothetical protein